MEEKKEKEEKEEKKFIDAYIIYDKKTIQNFITSDGYIEFFPSINTNTITINNIIISSQPGEFNIISTFFHELIKNYNITNIIIIKKNIIHTTTPKILKNFTYNNTTFYEHFDTYIFTQNIYKCSQKCCLKYYYQ